jgi:hypothetical protein
MAVATRLRFRWTVPPMLAAAAVASTAAHANGMASSGSPQTFAVISIHSQPSVCDIDQSQPQPSQPFEPRALLVEPTRPVVLDGVMYLENIPRSGVVGVRRAAATQQCPVSPNNRDFGVIHRSPDFHRYY